MMGSDWTLCAGIVDFLPFDYVLVQRKGSPWVWVYRQPAPERVPVFVTRFIITPADPHFPYGFDVLPD